MSELELEQRTHIKFLVKLGKSGKEIREMLVQFTGISRCGGRRALAHTHVAGIVYCPCTVVLININRVAREVATEKVGQSESVCDACERQQQASGRSSQGYLRWELVLRVHTIVHVCVCEGLQT